MASEVFCAGRVFMCSGTPPLTVTVAVLGEDLYTFLKVVQD